MVWIALVIIIGAFGLTSWLCGEKVTFGLFVLPGLIVAATSLIGFLFMFMAAEVGGFGTSRDSIEYCILGLVVGLTMTWLGLLLSFSKSE